MRLILCTCPPSIAGDLARHLVDHGAACVNILPGARSVYRWQGVVHDEEESLLLIKSPVGRVDALRESLRGVHPYELPEWVVIDVDPLTSPAYAAWVGAS
jgi:periplasmic divalent cation tolerance protein